MSTGGPWTRHGHPIPGVSVYPVTPADRPAVARCGGVLLCQRCREDAEYYGWSGEGGAPPAGATGREGWHEAAVRAVLALHSPDDAGYCRECGGDDLGEPVLHPCGTVATINDVRTSRLARD